MFYCLASQSASSNVITHNKKLLTTSFGSGSSDEGYSNTTVEKSRDKTDIIGTYMIVNEITLILIYNIQRTVYLKIKIFV